MTHRFEDSRRVEFADTDTAGIMHFSNFFRFMECTEHAFCRSLGFDVHATQKEGMHGFARVRAECRYFRPLRFQDVVTIRMSVKAKTAKTLTYEFVFLLPESGETDIARGEMEVIYVTKKHHDDRLQASDIPSEIADKIEVAPQRPNEGEVAV